MSIHLVLIMVQNMAKLTAISVEIPERCHDILQAWVNNYTTSNHRQKRAQIVLLAEQNVSNAQIARQLETTHLTVRKWRKRFTQALPRLKSLIEHDVNNAQLTKKLQTLLDDEQRPGTPPTFQPEQIVQIIRLACEDPAKSGLPVSHWSCESLARQAVENGIASSISPSTVRRFLKRS